jgi:hypothetical protein
VPLILVLVKVVILIVEIVKNALNPTRAAEDYFRRGLLFFRLPLVLLFRRI